MSHFTRVQVEVRDRGTLLDALGDMGWADILEDAQVRGWMGQLESAEIVARGENGYDVGFVRRGDGYEIVADWMGIEGGEEGFVGQLKQAYATRAVLANAARAGYGEVRRSRLEDGTIVLKLERSR